MRTVFIAASTALLAACQTVPDQPLRATAQLLPLKGSKAFGEVTFEQMGDKVRVIVFAQGLRPNQGHAFRIHEVGDCAGDGMSAKAYFNPYGKPQGQAGGSDLPALMAAKNGRAKFDATVGAITLEPGSASIIGRSVIIHADPSGSSGVRIACGVIKAG
jgi:Cu-Zn family superoxide dismutase